MLVEVCVLNTDANSAKELLEALGKNYTTKSLSEVYTLFSVEVDEADAIVAKLQFGDKIETYHIPEEMKAKYRK